MVLLNNVIKFTFFYWILHIKHTQCQRFRWPPYDSNYDYIVGIASKDGVHLGQGSIVSKKTIITSANILTPFGNDINAISVICVHRSYNESKTLNIQKIENNQVNRENVWIQMGEERLHSPVHDIALITLASELTWSLLRGPTVAEFPFSDKVPDSPVPSSGWVTAGFGFKDESHIRRNRILDTAHLEGSLLDCDEWFPRNWGHFICISNDENLPGVPSGGPLFQADKKLIIFGLGCFSLKKGNESILVFTNLRKYQYGLRGFIRPTSTTTPRYHKP